MTQYGSSNKEPGFDSVRKDFGEAMVQRFKNWPILTENWLRAQHIDETCQAWKDIETAKRNTERARTDKDFARVQAEVIARHIPEMQWAIVPSVAQLRREWDL
jgi:hypothetical protein